MDRKKSAQYLYFFVFANFCSKELNKYAIVNINKDKHVVKYGTILDIS